MSNCGCNSTPSTGRSSTSLPFASGDTSQSVIADERLLNLEQSSKMQLIGTEQGTLKRFPLVSRGVLVNLGDGKGWFPTIRPTIPMPYLRNFAKDATSGSIQYDNNNNPIEENPTFHSLVTSNQDGDQNRVKGLDGVEGEFIWDGFQFIFRPSDNIDPHKFCNVARVDHADDKDPLEVIFYPETTNQVVNGFCTPVTCYRPVINKFPLKPQFDAYVESTDQALEEYGDRLDAIESAVGGGETATGAAFLTGENRSVAATSLANPQAIQTWSIINNPQNIVETSGTNITVKSNGTYSLTFNGQVSPAGSGGGSVIYCYVYINGSNVNSARGASYVGNAVAAPTISTVWAGNLTEGDSIQIMFAASSSASTAVLNRITILKLV